MLEERGMQENNTFPRKYRLLCSADFDAVFAKPLKARSKRLTLLSKKNSLAHPRFASLVGKSKLKKAVDRNKLRRKLKESFRIKTGQLPNNDFLFLLNRGKHSDMEGIELEINQLWEKFLKN